MVLCVIVGWEECGDDCGCGGVDCVCGEVCGEIDRREGNRGVFGSGDVSGVVFCDCVCSVWRCG